MMEVDTPEPPTTATFTPHTAEQTRLLEEASSSPSTRAEGKKLRLDSDHLATNGLLTCTDKDTKVKDLPTATITPSPQKPEESSDSEDVFDWLEDILLQEGQNGSPSDSDDEMVGTFLSELLS